MPSILIVDDEVNIRRMVGALLQSEGYDVREASTGAEGVLRVADDEPDVALIDLMMPGELDGLATLARIRERWTELPVVMMSGRASLGDAVRATKLGAVNFLEKPLAPESVLLALGSALELRQSRRTARALREELGLTGEMVGDSATMARVREVIARVAPTESRVLVSGESGTGKELVAAAIHDKSARRDRPFVRVNCAAIPRDLVESEMFGHEKGSFTGATATRVGRFELAHTGTLFLDEIGDLDVEAQAKLLRAIEAKEIQRVGGNRTIRVDVRVIAATNRDLARAVADGSFREDLYFRLNVIPITLPPLRERGDDVVALVHHFSAINHQRTGRPALQWSEDALSIMRAYPWPGNVRELANIVERIAILNAGTRVGAADVRAVLPANDGSSGDGARGINARPRPAGLAEALEQTERELIGDALERANGNVAEAARQLQTDRPNLYRRMKRLGLAGVLLAVVTGSATSQPTRGRALFGGGTWATPVAAAEQRTAADTTEQPDSLRAEAPTASPPDSLGDGVTGGDTTLLPPIEHDVTFRAGLALSSGGTYNRVEGLPIMGGPTVVGETRRVAAKLQVFGIVRTARRVVAGDRDAGYDASLDLRLGTDRRFGVGGRAYDVVSPVERWQLSEPEAGLATFLLHRDYLDHYNRHGAQFSASWFVNGAATLTAGFANERWASRIARDPWSIFRNASPWRPNPVVDEGRVRLVTLDGTYDTRNDAFDPAGGWYLRGWYEHGTSPSLRPAPNAPGTASPDVGAPASAPLAERYVRYGRVLLDLRRYNRLSPRTRLNGRLVYGGHTDGGELPLERKFSMGGPGTLPGYDFRRPTGGGDVLQCTAPGEWSPAAPALCDRVVLGQLEFRTVLAEAPFDVANAPAVRLRRAGFTARPEGVLFVDVGRGWRTGVATSSGYKSDVGTGIDLGLLGVYVAKSVTDWGEPANLLVRVRRRF